jgi:hypothetical protein
VSHASVQQQGGVHIVGDLYIIFTFAQLLHVASSFSISHFVKDNRKTNSDPVILVFICNGPDIFALVHV